MPRTRSNPESRPKAPKTATAAEWLKAAGEEDNDLELRVLMAQDLNLEESYARSVAAERPMAEQVAIDTATDPGVELKDDFLRTLEVVAKDESSYVAGLLALLEQQAESGEQPDEMRRLQLLGLCELLTVMGQDESLMARFKKQSYDA